MIRIMKLGDKIRPARIYSEIFFQNIEKILIKFKILNIDYFKVFRVILAKLLKFVQHFPI